MRGEKSGGEIVNGNKEDTGWKSACGGAEGAISKGRRRLREGCSLRGIEGCSLCRMDGLVYSSPNLLFSDVSFCS